MGLVWRGRGGVEACLIVEAVLLREAAVHGHVVDAAKATHGNVYVAAFGVVHVATVGIVRVCAVGVVYVALLLGRLVRLVLLLLVLLGDL